MNPDHLLEKQVYLRLLRERIFNVSIFFLTASEKKICQCRIRDYLVIFRIGSVENIKTHAVLLNLSWFGEF